MHELPKAGHCGGLSRPRKHLAGATFYRLIGRRLLQAEAANRIVGRVTIAQAHRAFWQSVESAPSAIDEGEHFRHQIARGDVALVPHRAGVLIFDLGAALFELRHTHRHALQQVHRLKAGDDYRHFEFLHERPVLVDTHDRAHVARRQKSLHAIVVGGKYRLDSGRNAHVRDNNGKIGDLEARGLMHSHCGGRRGGFKAHGKEHHLARGFAAREVERIERRINHTHIGADGARVEKIAGRAGHAEHVAERAQRNARAFGQLDRKIDHLDRRHADGTSGAVNQRHFAWQQFIEPVADDGMGLPAADLHDGPGPRDRFTNLRNQRTDDSRIAKFVEEFHDWSSSASCVSISRASSSVRAACFSSTLLIAKPACTIA